MKKYLLSIFISFIVCSGCKTPETASLPNLSETYNVIWKYPATLNGEILEHKFVLKNPFKKTIKLEEVVKGCGCLTVNHNKDIIGPAESIEINTKMATAHKIGPSSAAVDLRFLVGDESWKVKLESRVVVYSAIETKPKYLILSDFKEQEIIIKSNILLNWDTLELNLNDKFILKNKQLIDKNNVKIYIQAKELPPKLENVSLITSAENNEGVRYYMPISILIGKQSNFKFSPEVGMIKKNDSKLIVFFNGDVKKEDLQSITSDEFDINWKIDDKGKKIMALLTLNMKENKNIKKCNINFNFKNRSEIYPVIICN